MQATIEQLLCLQCSQIVSPGKKAAHKTSEKGLQDGWTRATFILRRAYLERLKASGDWKRKKIREVIDEALGPYLRRKNEGEGSRKGTNGLLLRQGMIRIVTR